MLKLTSMKRKEVGKNKKVNGYYIHEFTQGFFGEQNEGKIMLRKMGLPTEIIPFSAVAFLQNRKIKWKDTDGNIASISFKEKPSQIEFFGSYLGKKKSYRMFREWGVHEDKEVIVRIESEAIGDLCMKCIYDNLIT